jgi:hypothetical protein
MNCEWRMENDRLVNWEIGRLVDWEVVDWEIGSFFGAERRLTEG